MIISASRRTDIPAYFAQWFINRFDAGFCLVPNPFNSKQISLVDLTPEKITAIVFWTRNPSPLFKYLNKLDDAEIKYYFQFTINGYPKLYEKFNTNKQNSITNFIELSNRIGSGRVIWRYDPILITDTLNLSYHKENFSQICQALSGYTNRVVISIVDDYVKTKGRLDKLKDGYSTNQIDKEDLRSLLSFIADIAGKYKMEVQSCAELVDLSKYGIKHGKCIDDEILRKQFGIDTNFIKDKSQRQACGCIVSKDIGINNTCLMGCEYCYATSSHARAVNNMLNHDPDFPMLYKPILTKELNSEIDKLISRHKQDYNSRQLDLF